MRDETRRGARAYQLGESGQGNDGIWKALLEPVDLLDGDHKRRVLLRVEVLETMEERVPAVVGTGAEDGGKEQALCKGRDSVYVDVEDVWAIQGSLDRCRRCAERNGVADVDKWAGDQFGELHVEHQHHQCPPQSSARRLRPRAPSGQD
jgi:hypothetical protein